MLGLRIPGVQRGLHAPACNSRAVPTVHTTASSRAGCPTGQHNHAREWRSVVCWAAEPASESPTVARTPPEELGLDREELAKKTHAAAKVFSSAQRKVGSTRLLVDSLKGTSILLLGDDAQLLREVARIMGMRLGWFQVDLPKVVCGMRKVKQLSDLSKDVADATEAEVLRGLRTQVRVIIPSLPDGATTHEDLWRDLWGNVIIWVDEQQSATEAKTQSAERALYESKAEIVMRIKAQKGFGVKNATTLEARAKNAAEQVLARLNDVLVEDPQLVERKRQYRSLGFRGDWPQLQPEGWNPVAQQLDRKPLEGAPQRQE